MITRNNYEEFFLLYVDNELSPAGRQAVEKFVGEHPDLKEELELLQQCRISPDEMPSFSGKEQLLRPAPLIHVGNYEAWFLSFVDDELDPASRQAVIDFVRRHPEKNIELQQLQRTVSTPDPDIVFPDKGSLYHEPRERLGKIAWLPFAGIAAAALILGAIGLLIFHPFRPGQGLAYSTGKQRSNGIAAASQPALAGATSSDEIKRAVPVTPRTVDPYHIQNKENRPSTPARDRTTHPVMAQVDPKRRQADLPGFTPNDAVMPAKVDPVTTAKTVNTDPVRDVAVAVPKMIDRNVKSPVTMTVISDQTQHDATGNANASFATQALLSQVSYQGSPDETPSPRKNKLRGIFRKVTRVLEKPAAREDDDNKKVTIGGFQFALE